MIWLINRPFSIIRWLIFINVDNILWFLIMNLNFNYFSNWISHSEIRTFFSLSCGAFLLLVVKHFIIKCKFLFLSIISLELIKWITIWIFIRINNNTIVFMGIICSKCFNILIVANMILFWNTFLTLFFY